VTGGGDEVAAVQSHMLCFLNCAGYLTLLTMYCALSLLLLPSHT
jgi:hypothetical protein